MTNRYAIFFVLFTATFINICVSSNILMITMGGTKSHKIPFWELARGLISRGHNITFINAFPPDFYMSGLEEITPAGLVFYVKNFTNWDLIGPKMRGEEPVSPLKTVLYAIEACDELLGDQEMQALLHSKRHFDLFIMDGAYPECSVGIASYLNIPFMYINTVGFYLNSISNAGSPTPFSMTPIFARGFTDDMTLFQRTFNTGFHLVIKIAHYIMVHGFLDNILEKHLGPGLPSVYTVMKNVSFILQNGHFTVTYPRPYLPNVAEIACIHCKPAKPLPKDLEEFISGGDDNGFIYVSMGSSVKEGNMPDLFKFMLLRVFDQLPYRVLWKWDTTMTNLSENVKVSRWLPQQDILGHPKLRAFVTHGGLLSMYETVYHGVPVVTIPVFCDHDANAAKAELDGYAIKLSLEQITVEKIMSAINRIIHDNKYREQVEYRQRLLRDQSETPLERAIFWTEYVLRHRGAPHLMSPSRHFSTIEYYLLDVFLVFCLIFISLYYCVKFTCRLLFYLVSRLNKYVHVTQVKYKIN
ncbi:UDP-glucosyltransferase 2 [Chrysoperla carnea]|uniref:UDP-glucosyltransferase 2 n=1 Tax=Chrysoperla carnea TaxID=189513 RepID=UPI001D0828BB|nr:UDP-glucosyltransferase 2 [Chrysoperla carnea]XP_044728729.1 UDP-glucosyltransferase 2 [Chrysoperla carnea]XP_044728730.1 UDP-glucosyltransferase 2 [Chrysoperla carnea]